MGPRSLIFTLYGDCVRPLTAELWIGTLIRLLAEFGFSPQAVRVAVSRMVQHGWLKARRVGARSFYSMTQRGLQRLEEGISRVYTPEARAWDGLWRVVTYQIPEEHRHLRDQFRKELTWRGFAPASSSIWVSPRDACTQVLALVAEYGLTGHVHTFVGRYSGPQDDAALARWCWDIAGINRRYAAFLDAYRPRFEEDRQRRDRGELPDNACFRRRLELVHEYRKFLHVDPGLPRELLPPGWLGTQAAELFRGYYELLSPGAARFVTAAAPPMEANSRRPPPVRRRKSRIRGG